MDDSRLPNHARRQIEKIACRRCGAELAACIGPQEHEVFVSVAFHEQDHRSEFCYERVFDYFESGRKPEVLKEEEHGTAKLFETHDGLVLCEEHFVAAFEEMSPPDRQRVHSSKGNGHELIMDAVTRDVLKPRCAMCGQVYSAGRTCQGCETPLHPLWPACHCSNECAHILAECLAARPLRPHQIARCSGAYVDFQGADRRCLPGGEGCGLDGCTAAHAPAGGW